MNKEDIRNKIYTYFGHDTYSEATIKLLEVMLADEIPTFTFALREDIKDQKQFLPTKAEPNATGYDVRAAFIDKQDLLLNQFDYFKIPLGFRAICPIGWYYQLHPRSSSFVKKHMHNLIGIIDETFSNELIFAGQYIPVSSTDKLIIKYGDAIAQILPKKYSNIYIEEVNNKEYDDFCKRRNAPRNGGFGSTG